MIRFLSPESAWMLAVPAAIIVLYLLRRRFQPQQVPSVFLWRRSVRDYVANRPFQRLMKNMLLPLQVLAALSAVLALMNPVLPGGTAGKTIFIFDVSGSMQAESEGRSRLELAEEEAVKLIRKLPAEEEITVITAGDEVQRLLLSGNRDEAERTIASITCGRGGAEIDRALTLAWALAQTGEANRSAAVTVFSDTLRLSDIHTRGSRTPSIVNVGQATENRSVYSLTAEKGSAYARVANFGKDCAVTLTCKADGTLCGARELTIPAGETTGVSFEIPEDAQKVRVEIREKDALKADNTAETAVKHAASLRVAVTEDNVFLESALKVRQNLTVMRTDMEALSSTDADLYILGSNPLILTTQMPEGAYDPAAASFGPFTWTEKAKTGSSPAAELTESPLTAGLTMKNVFFRQWHPISGGRTALRLDGDSVINWTEGMAVLGFDLHDTNLPLKYDFPILIQNILNTLQTEEQSPEDTKESVIPLNESDTRDTAPSTGSGKTEPANEQGRELRSILLIVFLMLLVAEMGVSRYVC